MDILIKRYDEPEPIFGIHFASPKQPPALIAEELLHEFYDFGNEVEFTMNDIWDLIPVEWKGKQVTREFVMDRVTAFDSITSKAHALAR